VGCRKIKSIPGIYVRVPEEQRCPVDCPAYLFRCFEAGALIDNGGLDIPRVGETDYSPQITISMAQTLEIRALESIAVAGNNANVIGERHSPGGTEGFPLEDGLIHQGGVSRCVTIRDSLNVLTFIWANWVGSIWGAGIT
jgi:hypothetical protein